MQRIEAVALIACLSLLGFIFELVRRREIKEKYSLLWFCTGACLLVFTLKREWLEHLSSLVGIYYPPSALFLILSVFMILILIHYSIVLSTLLGRSQRLSQKLALLEAELMAVKDQAGRS